jgi:hypothetical protein
LRKERENERRRPGLRSGSGPGERATAAARNRLMELMLVGFALALVRGLVTLRVMIRVTIKVKVIAISTVKSMVVSEDKLEAVSMTIPMARS